MLTYGAETLILTKNSINKIQIAQRRMEKTMLEITLNAKIPDEKIHRRTGVRNAVEAILTLKWNRTSHIAKM